ncbi:MAG: TrkH family potassium uptake protein [Muribaculaceae bacterium]|nr:TrkH family potassium uptake protein [Muribaculaceae bacterium]
MFQRTHSFINIPMLARVIGWLLLIETAFMSIPLATSIIDSCTDTMSFVISMVITGVSGLLMTLIRPGSREMGRREAIVLTASVWVVFSLFGMLPFLLSGVFDSFTDAFFETMSGFTTTGATLLTSSETVSKSIIMWRCVMQWIGGMGIILFTLAVLPMLNYQAGIQLFNAEVTGITHDKLRPRVSSSAKGLWLVYTLLTLLLIVLLSFSNMSFFEAVCHGLSTMSTGGFSMPDMSLHLWDTDYVRIVICIFMFVGGINFALLFKTFTGKFKGLLKNDALKWYLIVVALFYSIMALNILNQGTYTNTRDILLDPLVQTISVISSTGITDPQITHWSSLSVCLILVMMFIGACAGSTAGGAKIDRIIVIVKFIKNEFYRMLHPNTVTTVRINGNGTPTGVLHKSLAFMFLYLLVIVIGGLLLVATGLNAQEGFFYALAAISNTGLDSEILGLNFTYVMLSDAAKWILASIMLIGRLELFTILLIFTYTFWKK